MWRWTPLPATPVYALALHFGRKQQQVDALLERGLLKYGKPQGRPPRPRQQLGLARASGLDGTCSVGYEAVVCAVGGEGCWNSVAARGTMPSLHACMRAHFRIPPTAVVLQCCYRAAGQRGLQLVGRQNKTLHSSISMCADDLRDADATSSIEIALSFKGNEAGKCT